MQCKNCNTDFEGKFCPACGQRADTARITLKYLLRDIPHSIFHVDKGLLYTSKELFIRPADSMKEYLAGKRIRHFRPFTYVIILSAINSFITYQIYLYMYLEKTGLFGINSGDISNTVHLSSGFFNKYQSAFYFLMIPALSMCSWIFFNKKYNFWEQVVMNTYLTAQFNFLLIIAQVIALVNRHSISFVPFLVIFFTYLSYVHSRIFAVEDKGVKLAIKIFFLTVLIVLIYITGLTFAGIMTPWWK